MRRVRLLVVVVGLLLVTASCGGASSPQTNGPPSPSTASPSVMPTSGGFAVACTSGVLLPWLKQRLDDPARQISIERVDIVRCRGGYAHVWAVPRTNPSGAPQYDADQLFLRFVDGSWTVVEEGSGVACDDPVSDAHPPFLHACWALGYLPSGFTCAKVEGGVDHAADWEPTGPKVVAVRVGRHTGFDRFVIQFDGTVPTYRVSVNPSSTFTLSPKDEKVVLEGSGGVLIRLFPVDWTAYAGPDSLHPSDPFLREARLVENYEGYQQWGLGVAARPCYRVFTLDSPPRLIVDVATVQAGS